MLDYISKKPLGKYTLNEMIEICNAKKRYCSDCPLSSLCNAIDIPHIKHFYEKDLEEIVYFNSKTGETGKEDINETN
jgi:hypothetical protein